MISVIFITFDLIVTYSAFAETTFRNQDQVKSMTKYIMMNLCIISFMSCEEREWHIQNQKIVVLGAGGADCAIIVEMALQGAKEIVVYNRSEKPFIKELNQKLNCDIHLKSLSNKDELKQDLKDAYLLVQTTNVGMSPNVDQCLIDESYLSHQLKVADIIYKPAQTKLLKMAERLGLEYIPLYFLKEVLKYQ